MESSLSESVQQLVRPGKCVDLYYPDPETAEKQCFRTIQNTRYVQAFANLSGGSSVFTIPPNNGVQDIILTMEIPAGVNGSPVFDGRGLALPRAWAYSAVKQVSFRYGGSSQYFLSQQQLLENAIRKTPNSGARDDLFALGGEALAGTAAAQGDFSVPRRGYVWLSLPHTIPSADGKLPPLPTDLLTQQCQITVELNPIASIFSVAPGALGLPASSLSFGEFQVQQICLENQGDALARRVDMTSHALSYPIEFTQQEVVIPIANQASQQITLTGFRSGECKSVHVWVTDDADTSGPIKNPFKWYAPEDITMTYAGEVFARFDKSSSQLWNLVNGRQSAAVNEVLVQDAGGGACSVTQPFLGKWVELPFAQTYATDTAHSMYVAGKAITNGIVQLQLSLPVSLTPVGQLRLHVSYNYNAVLTFSQGTCDYVL